MTGTPVGHMGFGDPIADIAAFERTGEVLRAVHHERRRQDRLVLEGKFSWNCGDPRVPWAEKVAVLMEEVGEASREVVEWMTIGFAPLPVHQPLRFL